MALASPAGVVHWPSGHRVRCSLQARSLVNTRCAAVCQRRFENAYVTMFAERDAVIHPRTTPKPVFQAPWWLLL